MVGFARSAHASVWLRRPATLLGKSIDCPLVFASPNHDNLGFLRPRCSGCAGLEREKVGRGMRTARLSFSFRAQFRKRHRRQKKRRLPGDLRAVLLGLVGQHQQPGSVVLVLPCLKKAICRSQRGNIASYSARWGARGSRWRAKAWSSGQPVRTGPAQENINWKGKPSAHSRWDCPERSLRNDGAIDSKFTNKLCGRTPSAPRHHQRFSCFHHEIALASKTPLPPNHDGLQCARPVQCPYSDPSRPENGQRRQRHHR